MSTKQGLLLSITAVIAQGEQSVNEEGGCMYRGDGGCKCAIGFLIPDKKYNQEEMEGESVSDTSIKQVILESYKTDCLWISHLENLQACHDDCNNLDGFVSQFKEKIREAVEESGLPKYCLQALEEKS